MEAADEPGLNLGLRYEYVTPYVEVHDRQTSYDLTTGKQLFAAQNGNSRALYNGYKKGFQPRFGLAWTPARFHNRVVLRTAYGILNYLESTGTNRRLPMNPPYVYDFFVQYDARTPGQKITDGFPNFTPTPNGPPSGSIRVFPDVLKPAIIQQWNVTVETQLANNLTVSAGYVAQDADHLVLSDRYWSQAFLGTAPIQTRRPLYGIMPLVTEIVVTNPVLKQNYQGFQLSVRKRLASGLEFTSSYTWSHTMSDNAGFYGPTVGNVPNQMQDYHNRRAEWGPASMDIRHNWVSSYNYALPFGRGRQYLGTPACGGRGSGRLEYVGRADVPHGAAGDRGRVAGHVERRLAGAACRTRSGTRFWTSGVLTCGSTRQHSPARRRTRSGTPGMGRCATRGSTTLDFSLQKQFALSEHRRFEFRAEAFNISTSRSSRISGIRSGNSNFGRATAAEAEREMQTPG